MHCYTIYLLVKSAQHGRVGTCQTTVPVITLRCYSKKRREKKVTSGHASTDPKLEMNLKNVYNPIRKNHYNSFMHIHCRQRKNQTFSD